MNVLFGLYWVTCPSYVFWGREEGRFARIFLLESPGVVVSQERQALLPEEGEVDGLKKRYPLPLQSP